jgi:hypothetical protein
MLGLVHSSLVAIVLLNWVLVFWFFFTDSKIREKTYRAHFCNYSKSLLGTDALKTQFVTFVKNIRRQVFVHQRFQLGFFTVLYYLVGSVPIF